MWAIDKTSDFAVRFAKELENRGEVISWFDYKKNSFSKPLGNKNSKYYGSLDLARRINKRTGAFEKYNFDNFATLINRELLLNDWYIMLPLRALMDNIFQIFGLFGEEAKVFIRPNSSEKDFTGRLFDLEEFNEQISDFKDLNRNTKLIISKPKKIIGEWRLVCKKDQIIDGSLYRFNDLTTEVNNIPYKMRDFAVSILKQLNFNEIFTLDVAMMDNQSFKAIEINGCWTANLYACDPKKILDAEKC